MPRKPPKERCIYCNHIITPLSFNAPSVRNTKAWQLLMNEHSFDCGWLVSRGWQIDLIQVAQTRSRGNQFFFFSSKAKR